MFCVITALAAILVITSGLLYLQVVKTDFEQTRWFTLWEFFNVDREFNIPTWLASSMWLVLGIVAAVAGVVALRLKWLWFIFAAVGIYASADEAAMLHEQLYRLGSILTPYLPFDPFYYRWVIGGIVVAIGVIAVLLPLVWRLPLPIMLMLVAAGTIFLSGAVVMETLGGRMIEFHGKTTWHTMLLIHIEESLEFLGVALAIWAVFEMLIVRRTDEGLSIGFRGYR